MTARAIAAILLEESPERPDAKDLMSQFHGETQPEFYFQHLKRDFDLVFEQMVQSGVLQAIMAKYDPDVLANAIMQLTIDRHPSPKVRRAYLEIKRIGHSVML